MDVLLQSLESYPDYPQNVLRLDLLSHTLKSYFQRLQEHSDRLFDEKNAAVDFLDFGRPSELTQSEEIAQREADNSEVDFLSRTVSSPQELRQHLREALDPGNHDPKCRFM